MHRSHTTHKFVEQARWRTGLRARTTVVEEVCQGDRLDARTPGCGRVRRRYLFSSDEASLSGR